MSENNGHTGTLRLKTGLAEMLKGGVIMDVVTADQAKIAEDAGATAVMALERVPSDQDWSQQDLLATVQPGWVLEFHQRHQWDHHLLNNSRGLQHLSPKHLQNQ